ncbi:MAG: tetratricopeptide repeat protein, partial [Alphaproteobacteria bacterium]|nr:tetratricopeptide repeat protein [Alphaproteobacteria bacterium]
MAEPETAETLLARFLALQQAGDLAGSLPVIEALARQLPGNPKIQAFLANTLERLDRARDALAAYDAAIALDPGYVDARHNRACLLARLGDGRAETGFVGVLALAPDHAGARAALTELRARRLQPAFDAANARVAAGDRAGAAAAYRAILAELPDNVPALHNLAGLLAERDPQEALSLWRRALALAPDDLAVRASLGQHLFQRGDLEAALPHLEQVVARDPAHTAVGELAQIAADRCDWSALARLQPQLAAAIHGGTPVIPLAAVRVTDDPDLVTRAGENFWRHVIRQAFPGGVTPSVHTWPRARSAQISDPAVRDK